MNRFRNFIQGFVYIWVGLVLLITLGFVYPKPYKIRDWMFRIEYRIRRYFWRREHDAQTFRVTPEGGRYLTRDGRIVYTRPNDTGWYDKLAFVVTSSPDGPPIWTVDEKGWAYPGPTISKTPMDLVCPIILTAA